MDFSKPRGASFGGVSRRVFTAPIPSTARPSSSSSSQSDNGLVDTLYDHPNVKIVSFTAGSHALTLGPRPTEIEPGSLSWSNQLERTIAAGAFRIYRAPGSVAFINCGAALQPILPKSQAWCVDEESSKFVLQIRRPQYWRIELPVEQDEDKRRAQILREVLDKILQFEKTECPFQRSFTVELPERPQTPVKKKPWTPVRRSSACLPVRPVTPVEIAHVHRGPPNRPRGSICMGDLRTADFRTLGERRTLEPPSEETTQNIPENEVSPKGKSIEPALRPNPIMIKRTKDGGPVTPPQLIVMTPPISHSKAEHSSQERKLLAESPDSFPTPDSWHSTPLPPSPPQSNPGSPVISISPPKDSSQAQEAREAPHLKVASQESGSTRKTELCSVTGTSANQEPERSPKATRLETPYLNVPEEAVEEEPEQQTLAAAPDLSYSTPITSSSSFVRRPPIRRATTSSSISPDRRVLFPFPSAADIFAPRQSQLQIAPKQNTSPVATLRRLPMTMINKTCEILMSPPSHLINVMLKVSARIAAGEWRGLAFGTSEDGERIPVQWDYSEEEDHYHQNTHISGRRSEWTRTYDDHDWWLKRLNPKDKMAGTFPESDDEDVDPLEVGGISSKNKDGGSAVGKNAEWENVD